jgi:hypothetical protein
LQRDSAVAAFLQRDEEHTTTRECSPHVLRLEEGAAAGLPHRHLDSAGALADLALVLESEAGGAVLRELTVEVPDYVDLYADDLVLDAMRDPHARIDRIIEKFRAKFLALNIKANKELIAIMADYHERVVGRLIASGVLDGPWDRATERAVMNELAEFTTDLRRDVQAYLQRSTVTSAEMTMLRENALLSELGRGLPDAIRTALASTIPVTYLSEKVWTVLDANVLGGPFTLSDKIWVYSELAQNQVMAVVRNGLLSGDDAVTISKALEQVLVPTKRAKDAIWSHATAPRRLKTAVSGAAKGLRTAKGTVSYNYLRLARSEMFRAQKVAHQANVLGLQSMFPFEVASGIKWNLSGSHPKWDVCDSWASEDPYNLGPGVYPPDSVPLGHANDMCNTTSVLISPEQFVHRMKLWEAGLAGQLADRGKITDFRANIGSEAGARTFARVFEQWAPTLATAQGEKTARAA